ncbi:hypothetical protein V6Z11_A12G248400 [Gossypium hirsutum]
MQGRPEMVAFTLSEFCLALSSFIDFTCLVKEAYSIFALPFCVILINLQCLRSYPKMRTVIVGLQCSNHRYSHSKVIMGYINLSLCKNYICIQKLCRLPPLLLFPVWSYILQYVVNLYKKRTQPKFIF